MESGAQYIVNKKRLAIHLQIQRRPTYYMRRAHVVWREVYAAPRTGVCVKKETNGVDKGDRGLEERPLGVSISTLNKLYNPIAPESPRCNIIKGVYNSSKVKSH